MSLLLGPGGLGQGWRTATSSPLNAPAFQSFHLLTPGEQRPGSANPIRSTAEVSDAARLTASSPAARCPPSSRPQSEPP